MHGLIRFDMAKSLSRGGEGALLSRTRKLMRRYGIRARKGLGQHFLIDERVLDDILVAADLTPNDIVIEVGPGLGILTAELVKQAGQVIAIELDDTLAEILKQELLSDNVEIVHGDILEIDLERLLEANSGEYKVVANLPYYITSPVLRRFLEAPLKPENMVVTVQKEVAEAIAAGPGKSSLLSVSVQFYGRPHIVTRVPAVAFYPEPEVDSAVVKIDVYPCPVVDVADIGGFFDLVRAGFTATRKQSVNSLAMGLGLSREIVQVMLKKANIQPQRRAETFTLEEWARLYEIYRGTETKK